MKIPMKWRPVFLVGAIFLVMAVVAGFGYGCTKKEKPPVIIVIFDTLPAGHVSCYGYSRSTTPHIDWLAEDGIRFEHAIAPAPWTLPSIASILTGTFPSRHSAGFHLDPPTVSDRRLAPLRPEMVTLPSLFQEKGYQTAGIFNNPFTHPGYGLDKGFDTYNYVGGDNLLIRRATEVVNNAVEWIELHKKKPFFIVVHFFDPHLAYDPPLHFAMPYISDYKGRVKIPFSPHPKDIRSGKIPLSDEDKKFVIGLYDGEVTATDFELGRFIAYLKENGIYDKALIVLTADHGEEFWERGSFEHGHSLHREVVEVPLIIKFPGIESPGQVVGEYVSLVDIFPTIAEFMGWPLPFSLDGISLYPRGGRLRVLPHTVVTENTHYGPQQQAFYDDGFKLIVNRETGKMQVYDLKNDPSEQKDMLGKIDLPDSVKSQVQKMAKDLEEAMKNQVPEAAKIDAETLEKLKSLGYISD